MPLAKKMKGSGKMNQGAQTKPGNAGNIKKASVDGAQGPRPAVSSKRGRNLSIGRK